MQTYRADGSRAITRLKPTNQSPKRIIPPNNTNQINNFSTRHIDTQEYIQTYERNSERKRERPDDVDERWREREREEQRTTGGC